MIFDQTGSLANVVRHDYLPFGEPLVAGGRTTSLGYGADEIRQGFVGYEQDSETDLKFAQARYHSSTQGRFTSPDPYLTSAYLMGPQSWNRYAYCLNNPGKFVDPSGLRWLTKGHRNFTWVDDDKYVDSEWVRYETVEAGTVVFFGEGWGDYGQDKYSRILGGYVTLNADGTLSDAGDGGIKDAGDGQPEEEKDPEERQAYYGTPDGVPDNHVAHDGDDFRRINLSISPKVLMGYGVSFSYTWDKYHRHYFSVGPTVGFGLPVSGNIQTGQTFMNGEHTRNKAAVENILTGSSAGINICPVICGSTTWNVKNFDFLPVPSTGGSTVAMGVGLPEVSFTKDWTWKLPF
jgi:RHS repeat-associated protein